MKGGQHLALRLLTPIPLRLQLAKSEEGGQKHLTPIEWVGGQKHPTGVGGGSEVL